MEDNKLIADFMGKEWHKEFFKDVFIISPSNITYKFDTDWNWLMEVVEKIESIIFDDNNSFNVTIGSTNYCVIQDSNGDTYESVEDYGETKLLTTYKAIVKFIKWYNDENSR